MQQDDVTIRASQAPLGWLCSESLNVSELRVQRTGDPAELGTAYHKWAEHIDSPDTQPALPELASRYAVDLDDLQAKVAAATVMWRNGLAEWFAGGVSEVRLTHREPVPWKERGTLHTSATIDRHKIEGRTASLLDWKTGRQEGDHGHQLRTGAWLLCEKHPDVDEVYAVVPYVTLGFWDSEVWSREQLDDWRADYLLRLRNGQGQFAVGDHCRWCSRFYDCPGAQQYREACRSLAARDPDEYIVPLTEANAPWQGPRVAEEVRRVRFIKQWCEEYLSLRRQEVADVGGEVDAGDGRVLRVTERTTRRYVDPALGANVLNDFLDAQQQDRATAISASKCEDAIRKGVPEDAPRGTKKRLVMEFRQRLEDANALRTSTAPVLSEGKKQ